MAVLGKRLGSVDDDMQGGSGLLEATAQASEVRFIMNHVVQGGSSLTAGRRELSGLLHQISLAGRKNCDGL